MNTTETTAEIETPAVRFAGEHALLIQICGNLDEAKTLAAEHDGIILDYDKLVDAYKDAKRDEIGTRGGYSTHLFLDEETSEISWVNYENGSGPLNPREIVLGDEYVVGSGGVDLFGYLKQEWGGELGEEYWENVRDKFDELFNESEISEDEIGKGFEHCDCGDGHGGTKSYEDAAEEIFDRILDKLEEDGSELSESQIASCLEEIAQGDRSTHWLIDVRDGSIEISVEQLAGDYQITERIEDFPDRPDEDENKVASDEAIEEWAKKWASCYVENWDISEKVREFWNDKLRK